MVTWQDKPSTDCWTTVPSPFSTTSVNAPLEFNDVYARIHSSFRCTCRYWVVVCVCIEDFNDPQSHNVFMLWNNFICLLFCTGGATATPFPRANITDLCRVLSKCQSAKTLDPTIYLVNYFILFHFTQTLFVMALYPIWLWVWSTLWTGIRLLQVNITIKKLLSFYANFSFVGPVS